MAKYEESTPSLLGYDSDSRAAAAAIILNYSDHNGNKKTSTTTNLKKAAPPPYSDKSSTRTTTSSLASNVSSNKQQQNAQQSLPRGWTKGFSRSRNRYYYCYPSAEHTQWHFPTISEVEDPVRAIRRVTEETKVNPRTDAVGGRSGTDIGGGGGVSDFVGDAGSVSTLSHQHHQPNKSEPLPQSLKRKHSSSSPVKTLPQQQQEQQQQQQRSKQQHQESQSSLSSRKFPPHAASLAIIVPYRDIHPAQKRSEHLKRFIPHMKRFLNQRLADGTLKDYHIYIIDQSNDNRKFNRGKLLNIGFNLATKRTVGGKSSNDADKVLISRRPILYNHDAFIFHDVDLLPGLDLSRCYITVPHRAPLHIARVWGRYSNNPKYFGGIMSVTRMQYEKINGYPNNFWGWGGEDDEVQKRCEITKMKWESPKSGTITDLEDMSLKEKLNFLRENKAWKCMSKWEALDEHESTWRTNGLHDLKYQVIGTKALFDDDGGEGGLGRGRATKITVNVQLNGNHWSNDKCGIEYLPGP